MNPLVLSLDAGEEAIETVGGKALNLIRLTRAQFPVPPGFVIATAAYRAFVRTHNLEERIAELCRSTDFGDTPALKQTSEAIRRLFDDGAIPLDVADAIRRAYRALSDRFASGTFAVAVRSSATAEDLPEASFAGQQETFLNIVGDSDLLRAIRSCWASLWSPRAIAYRARLGIDPSAVDLAVIIQEMIAADAAGVLFTVNPITGDHQECVIDAVWGLGPAIVEGRVTPDHFVVDRNTGRLKHTTVGDKTLMVIAREGGTADVAVDPERRRQPALAPEQAVELARLGREIATCLGGPQDIEWAIAGHRTFILQARPVTALPTDSRVTSEEEGTVPGDDAWPAVRGSVVQPFDLWTRANLGESYPLPISTLSWSVMAGATSDWMGPLLGEVGRAYVEVPWVRRFYGRVYFNEGALTHLLSQEFGLPGAVVHGIDTALGSRRSGGRRTPAAFHLARFLRGLPVGLRLGLRQAGSERRLQALFPQIDAWVESFTARDLSSASDQELWSELSSVWSERAGLVNRLHILATASAMVNFSCLRSLLGRWLKREDLAPDLVTGLSGVYVAEIGRALWGMARRLRELNLAGLILENPPEVALASLRATSAAQPIVAMFEEFLRRHGHCCANGSDFLYPRWAESPVQILDVLAGYLRAGDRLDAADAEDRQRRRREEAEAWVVARLRPVRRAIFRGHLARTQHGVRLRDNGRHYFAKILFPFARTYRTLGEQWVRRGWLREPDEFFFLNTSEIEGILHAGRPDAVCADLSVLATERRKAFDHWHHVQAPEVIDRDGRPVAEETADASSEPILCGIPASSGKARGTARILDDIRQAGRLAAGDILVTRATDPGWTPVFPLLAGLVLEVGGQLSHGAIVAREYGVPAVVSVPDAMLRIRDGQPITIDGSTGSVYL